VFQYASRMEEAFEEQGLSAWISPDKGVVIDGQLESAAHPTAHDLIGPAGALSPAGAAAPDVPPPNTEDTGAADDVTSDDMLKFEKNLSDAAKRGTASLRDEWKKTPPRVQHHFHSALEARFKPMAEQVDLRVST